MIRRRCSQCGEDLSFSEHDPCDVCSMVKFDLQFIPKAVVRDALAELWADALRLPAADYSTDGDGAELIKQDAVLKLIGTTMTALGLGAEGEKR